MTDDGTTPAPIVSPAPSPASTPLPTVLCTIGEHLSRAGGCAACPEGAFGNRTAPPWVCFPCGAGFCQPITGESGCSPFPSWLLLERRLAFLNLMPARRVCCRRLIVRFVSGRNPLSCSPEKRVQRVLRGFLHRGAERRSRVRQARRARPRAWPTMWPHRATLSHRRAIKISPLT